MDTENKLWLPKEKDSRADKLRVWDYHMYTTIYKIDKPQEHTVRNRKLYSIFCNSIKWKRIRKIIDIYA